MLTQLALGGGSAGDLVQLLWRAQRVRHLDHASERRIG
jgi:hypothetical protein